MAEAWDDPEVLRELHQDQRLSGRQIAKQLDVSQMTISRRLNKFGIEMPPLLQTKRDGGHVNWRHLGHRIYVHRLLAVAEYGFDAVCDKKVHHKNEIPWDNRPDNIELLTQREHRGEHTKAKGVERKAIACAYEFTDMSSYDIAETCDYAPNSVRRIHSEYF